MLFDFSEYDSKWKIIQKNPLFLTAKGSYLDEDCYVVITFEDDDLVGEVVLSLILQSDFDSAEDFQYFIDENKDNLEEAAQEIADTIMWGNSHYEEDDKGRIIQMLLFEEDETGILSSEPDEGYLLLLYKHHKRTLKVFNIGEDELLDLDSFDDFPQSEVIRAQRHEEKLQKKVEEFATGFMVAHVMNQRKKDT